MISLEDFKVSVYEKMMDVYTSLCRRCQTLGQAITQSNDVIFNNREDVRRINEAYDLLRDADIRVAEVFEIMTRVDSLVSESNNLKLKEFGIYADITTAHLQASFEMCRSLKNLSESFKRKID
jgi:uncharacterized secreted protein with C-terminal beta-propeller domain